MDAIKMLVDLADQGKWAIVFLVLNVVTVAYCYREIRSRNSELKVAKDEAKSTTERVVKALEQASHATEDQTEVMTALRTSIDQARTQTVELLAYLKGRDEGRRS